MWCTACQTWTSSCLGAQVGPPAASQRSLCGSPRPDWQISATFLAVWTTFTGQFQSVSWHEAMFTPHSWLVSVYVQRGTMASRCAACALWSSLFLNLTSVDVCNDPRGSKSLPTPFLRQPSKMWVCLEEEDFWQATFSWRIPTPACWKLRWQLEPSMKNLKRSDVIVAAPPPIYPSFLLTVHLIFYISSWECEVLSWTCLSQLYIAICCFLLKLRVFLPSVLTSSGCPLSPSLTFVLLSGLIFYFCLLSSNSLLAPVTSPPSWLAASTSPPLLFSSSADCAVLISSYMSAAANARLLPSVFGLNTFLFLPQDTRRTGRRLRDGRMRRTERKSSSSQEAWDELKDKCVLFFDFSSKQNNTTFFFVWAWLSWTELRWIQKLYNWDGRKRLNSQMLSSFTLIINYL